MWTGSWPSSAPLELRMAASRANQDELELMLGEPSTEGRHDVVYINGLPTLRRLDAGEVTHQAWTDSVVILPLNPPGQPGVDCLRLRIEIDGQAQLVAAIKDLRNDRDLGSRPLGTVR